jgi:hypothetical protein
MGTYWELDENKNQIPTPPYHPQREKSLDPLDA